MVLVGPEPLRDEIDRLSVEERNDEGGVRDLAVECSPDCVRSARRSRGSRAREPLAVRGTAEEGRVGAAEPPEEVRRRGVVLDPAARGRIDVLRVAGQRAEVALIGGIVDRKSTRLNSS